MSTWFSNLVEKFTELSWPAVLPFVLLLAAGIALVILSVKKAPKAAIIAVSLIALALLVVLLVVTFPAITPDLEAEGGTAAGSWLYSSTFWIIVLCVVGLVALLLLLRRQQWTTHMLATGALCVALGFILSCITVYKLPQGGSITPASMLPIMFFAWVYGPIPGVCAGLVHGVLQLIQGAYVLHPLQFLLDYIFPFAVLGLAGLFRRDKQLWLGVLVAGVCRYIVHFLSGYVFFGSYAPEGMSPALYSLGYNASYMAPEIIICVVIVLIPGIQRQLIRLRNKAQADRA
jgi:thiamine transporter